MFVYRDKCKQSELSDLFAGGSTQVEPGSGGSFPVIEPSALRSYTGELVHCLNSNYEKRLAGSGPTFCPQHAAPVR